MSKFNGHKNWNHWNVSLWINNDEWLYAQAVAFQRRRTKNEAARDLLAYLREMGQHETPDGAPYSVSSIRAAMVGM